jgi:hypothetical protein
MYMKGYSKNPAKGANLENFKRAREAYFQN